MVPGGVSNQAKGAADRRASCSMYLQAPSVDGRNIEKSGQKPLFGIILMGDSCGGRCLGVGEIVLRVTVWSGACI